MSTKTIFYPLGIHAVYLPAGVSISHFWNFGSSLGLFLFIQIGTGLFLAMHYSSDVTLAFDSINHMMRDVNYGWMLRIFHMNGASLFFFFMYFHIARSLYYGGYYKKPAWVSGIFMFLLSMATAFLGYVLPWGQMSFWGATVITNLISALPYAGQMIVEWVWGGFSVGNATLTRFYTLHFILPLILVLMMVGHVMLLHEVKSSNPMGIQKSLLKAPFHPYLFLKDMISFYMFLFVFFLYCMFFSWALMDLENFFPANYLSTPIHIQPEWYFLFAYTILRAIPNKLGGVLGLLMSILILFGFLLVTKYYQNMKIYLKHWYVWSFFVVFILLTWLGSKPVEYPFILLSMIVTFMYFFMYMLFFLLLLNEELIITSSIW